MSVRRYASLPESARHGPCLLTRNSCHLCSKFRVKIRRDLDINLRQPEAEVSASHLTLPGNASFQHDQSGDLRTFRKGFVDETRFASSKRPGSSFLSWLYTGYSVKAHPILSLSVLHCSALHLQGDLGRDAVICAVSVTLPDDSFSTSKAFEVEGFDAVHSPDS